MKKDWDIKKLGDICDFFAGYTPKQNELSDLGDIPYFKVSDMNRDGNELFMSETELYAVSPKKIIPKDSIVFPKNGGAVFTNKKRILLQDSVIDLNSEGLFHKDYIDVMFLYYFLQLIDLKDYSKGAALPTIDMTALKNVSINVPPLEEQKRIVKILDEKFAQLEKIKANAQTNLQNAKNLFQSQLTKAFSNTTWEKKRLGDVSSHLFAGGDAPKENYSKEKTEKYHIPIYANAVAENGLYGFTDVATVFEPSVTIAARGSGTGYVILRNEPFLPIVRLIVAVPRNQVITQKYLYFALRNIPIDHSGAAIPQLTIPMIRDYEIPLPLLPEQKRIVKELDTLSEKVRQLQEIYTKQIANCDELKQAYLQKAFEGEL